MAGVAYETFRRWVRHYEAEGVGAFKVHTCIKARMSWAKGYGVGMSTETAYLAQGEYRIPLQGGSTEYVIRLEYSLLACEHMCTETEQTAWDDYDRADKLVAKFTTEISDPETVWTMSTPHADFEKAPKTQAKAKELTRNCKTDAEKVTAIFNWVIDNIKYDDQLNTVNHAYENTKHISCTNTIKILAPAPYKTRMGKEVIDEDGAARTVEVEIRVPAFKIVTCFDVSQTEGKPLPSYGVTELDGTAGGYAAFWDALLNIAPCPIGFEDIPGASHGYYHLTERRIAIQSGMSQVQTLKTGIHEIAHATLHALPEDGKPIDRRTREVQAKSVMRLF